MKAILNSTAWTSVDVCVHAEKLAVFAEKLNGEASRNLAFSMREVNGILFHISTNFAFGRET